ncbi:hypothetical protein IWQ62_000835 [Dispira parvispora]|uniref:Uncharacterized protein n=1 Tax=Dispira parvispora TaxID=1520584 RepID=A0A9W8AV17_9FUNG|nr:hypothetical protein IWQ62_000835 [Dispira parvispora]
MSAELPASETSDFSDFGDFDDFEDFQDALSDPSSASTLQASPLSEPPADPEVAKAITVTPTTVVPQLAGLSAATAQSRLIKASQDTLFRLFVEPSERWDADFIGSLRQAALSCGNNASEPPPQLRPQPDIDTQPWHQVMDRLLVHHPLRTRWAGSVTETRCLLVLHRKRRSAVPLTKGPADSGLNDVVYHRVLEAIRSTRHPKVNLTDFLQNYVVSHPKPQSDTLVSSALSPVAPGKVLPLNGENPDQPTSSLREIDSPNDTLPQPLIALVDNLPDLSFMLTQHVYYNSD